MFSNGGRVVSARPDKVEHNIKELSPKEKVSKRLEQSVTIFEVVRAILDEQNIDHVPPKACSARSEAAKANETES